MEPDLAQLREEAADSLDILFDDAFPEVLEEGSVEELTGLVREACVYFHVLGVTTLLLDASPQHLFYQWGCAAENWRRLLLHLRGQGAALPPTSDHAPLLGAVAAGYWELARGLCQVSATERGEEEYEDEFAWARLLQELIVLPAGETLSEEVLQRHRPALEASQPDRLEVLLALMARDRNRFADALARLAPRHAAELEALEATASPEERAAHRFIWFEGLALLRLAERAGLTVEAPLLYCPPLARVPMKMEYDGDWALPFGPGKG